LYFDTPGLVVLDSSEADPVAAAAAELLRGVDCQHFDSSFI